MPDSGFASLGATLLARKGGAKPAMRPQLPPLDSEEGRLAALADEQLEDLGWNDMGEGLPEAANGADVVPINAAAAGEEFKPVSPIVHRQQRRIEERVLADAAMACEKDEEEFEDSEDYAEFSVAAEEADEDDSLIEGAFASLAGAAGAKRIRPVRVPAPAQRPAAARKPACQQSRRAAFTLRLDAERHLKLRLAATMQGVSAQALLTEALDAMLAEFEDLDAIAARLKRH